MKKKSIDNAEYWNGEQNELLVYGILCTASIRYVTERTWSRLFRSLPFNAFEAVAPHTPFDISWYQFYHQIRNRRNQSVSLACVCALCATMFKVNKYQIYHWAFKIWFSFSLANHSTWNIAVISIICFVYDFCSQYSLNNDTKKPKSSWINGHLYGDYHFCFD